MSKQTKQQQQHHKLVIMKTIKIWEHVYDRSKSYANCLSKIYMNMDKD